MQMGAMMNEFFQAKEGLPPDLFPEDVPTYTGHYHKPHTVANTNIHYVGSPYQGVSSPLHVCITPATDRQADLCSIQLAARQRSLFGGWVFKFCCMLCI